jgi:hypothetical protein
MATATAKNIIVGAARVWISYGAGSNRPNFASSAIFPFNQSAAGSYANSSTASGKSTTAFLQTSASGYWRDFGFTSTGVDVSYEPGYSDVVVDQLLDAARLFQQSLKVIVKTELDEGLFENMNIVWGQQEAVYNLGSAGTASAPAISPNTTGNGASVTQLALNGGALGIAPVERSLVFVGQAPGSYGTYASYPAASSSVSAVSALADTSSNRSKERVYVARRVVQEQTTAHSLKRDAATVFPVSFRCLPDTDGVSGGTVDQTAGTEYGFIIDRLYG